MPKKCFERRVTERIAAHLFNCSVAEVFSAPMLTTNVSRVRYLSIRRHYCQSWILSQPPIAEPAAALQ